MDPQPFINIPARAADINDPLPETDPPNFIPIIDDIKTSLEFIAALQNASLTSEDEPTDSDLLDQIRKPKTSVLEVDDPDQ